MRIAHFGTFDVANYGDLLFPHLAEWRWPNAEWVHVSPVGSRLPFSDALPTIDVETAFLESFDAVVVGGGNIVRLRPSSLPVYASVARSAYASLWLGAAVLASTQKIPLVFNAPSVSSPRVGVMERELLRRVFGRAAYLAFRDPVSVDMAASLGSQAELVPDTAFDVARMWPMTERSPGGGSYLAAHVNRRYMTSVDETARKLDVLAERHDMPIHLLAIGPCHGDVETTERVAGAMQGSAHLVPITTLQGMAHSIAGSSYYVGSSMHGFITALAYRRPAMLVLNDAPMNKFEGVFRAANMTHSVVKSSWELVPEDLTADLTVDDRAVARMKSDLDAHWRRLTSTSVEGGPTRALRFARSWRNVSVVAGFEAKVTKRIERIIPGSS